jgi:hypothetical protein
VPPCKTTVTYNDGFLGQENEEYQAWILDKKHWGGAIELSILSKHYGRVIAAYDIQTKRCDRCARGRRRSCSGSRAGWWQSAAAIGEGCGSMVGGWLAAHVHA